MATTKPDPSRARTANGAVPQRTSVSALAGFWKTRAPGRRPVAWAHVEAVSRSELAFGVLRTEFELYDVSVEVRRDDQRSPGHGPVPQDLLLWYVEDVL